LNAVMMAITEGADIARVPFISEKKKSMDQRIFDIILFNDGKQLTPLELGETYKRLIDFGYNINEIAKKIGKSVNHVSDMTAVAGSSKGVKDIIKEGLMSATLVAEIKSKVKDVDKAEKIITDAAINVDGTKNKVTKKNLIESVPELKKPEVAKVEVVLPEPVKEETTLLIPVYTASEVRELLMAQVNACAESLPEEYKDIVYETKLVL